VFSVVLACSGCATGITVTPVTSDNAPSTGNPWNLPMTQFKITITRHVVACGPEVKGTVEALPAASVVLDPQQRYVLESKGWWATSDITSNLAPSGFSTGLNAESTDATTAVISNVIGTIAKVAVSVAALAGSAEEKGVQAQPPSIPLCSPDVAAAVEELYPAAGSGKDGLKKQADEAVAALASATAKVALLTAQANADKTLKKDLVAALATQATRQSRLAAVQAKLANALKITADVQVVTWPHRASDVRKDTPYVLDPAVFNKWFTQDANRTAIDQFNVYLALYRQNSAGGWIPPGPAPTCDVSLGVPVRLAQTGRLLICTGEPCPQELDETKTGTKKISMNDFNVLQFGKMYIVPLTGGSFKAEKAVIALDQNGLPTSIQVVEKVAAAAALAGTAKDAATQFADLPAQIRAAQLAKTKAQIDQAEANAALANAGLEGQTSNLAAQTAFINAQNELAMAQENAGLQRQTSGLAAQTSLLNAQAALATAQANAQVVDQTSVLGAQATLINAQASQINASAALARAQVLLLD